MIKIAELDKILKKSYNQDVLECAGNYFYNACSSTAPVNEFVQDFTQMNLSQAVYQSYYNEGYNVLVPMLQAKKKLDISMVNPMYVTVTGLLAKEFVIGCDVTKGMSTSIYTKSYDLLYELFLAGAFDNVDKFNKGIEALFGKKDKQDYGNKVAACFEKASLAMARIDIAGVIGDSVSLDLIIPNKFRTDYGTGFKIYPYTVFPFLSTYLKKMVKSLPERKFKETRLRKQREVVDIRAVNIMSMEPVLGQTQVNMGNVKTRNVTFFDEEVFKAYKRGNYPTEDHAKDAHDMLIRNIKKTNCTWDCLKLYLKGFNVEASLYSVPYTTIRFERITKISPVSLKNIDTSRYMIDFDSVRKLFISRVNNWKLADFEDFGKMVDTSACANIPERIQVVNAWANEMKDEDLYKLMLSRRNLFEPTMSNGEKKTIEDGLEDMYRQTPNALKKLQFVDLESDFEKRVDQLKDLLKSGVCKIETASSRTGAPRVYLATNHEGVLKTCYGSNVLGEYESDKRAIQNMIKLIEDGKIKTYRNFVDKLHLAKIDGLVDYGQLEGHDSTPSEWLLVLKTAALDLEAKTSGRKLSTDTNKYLVNFRRINAFSSSSFYGSVDVRNITSLEFGKQDVRSPRNRTKVDSNT